jgi:xanthine permease XanP
LLTPFDICLIKISPNQTDQLDLVYGLNDRPRPIIAFLAAFQHLLAIIVPIVTPGLLICLALGVSKEDTNMILSMSLVISGIATFLQCKKVGPFGAGLLIVQGTSFNFIGPIIGIGSAMVAAGTPVESVMAAIFGVVIAGSFIEMGVSRILPWVKMLITPLVTGIVVLLIGLTLIKEGLISMGGGYQAMSNNTFANSRQLNHVVYSARLDYLVEPYPYYLGKKFSNFNCLGCGYVLQALWGIWIFLVLKTHL